MKLIVGLGNPGKQYAFTRHNFGFLALDFYFKLHQLSWEPHPKFNAIYAKHHDLIFIKPQTYYNAVGESVQAFMHFYKIASTDLLVLCDDFNLPFGSLRYRSNGSTGGNNGLKSITQQLSDSTYPRLRLGTGNDPLRQRLGDTDFVLSKFTATEKSQLPQLLLTISKRLTQQLST